MNTEPNMTEDDLHAYIDDALPPNRRLEVERHLEHDEVAARRVAGFTAQRAALRAALAPIVAETIPPSLDLAHLITQHGRKASFIAPFEGWRSAAAALLILVIGGASGWSAREVTQSPPNGIVALAQEASDTYAAYAPDHIHPVEFRADDKAELTRWIGDRLHQRVVAPDLTASGYRFMGGRVVATPHGPAGMFMYDDDKGTRVVLLTRPMQDGAGLPMTEYRKGAVGGYSWAANGLGYSLAGPEAAVGLHPLADEARRQLAGSI